MEIAFAVGQRKMGTNRSIFSERNVVQRYTTDPSDFQIVEFLGGLTLVLVHIVFHR